MTYIRALFLLTLTLVIISSPRFAFAQVADSTSSPQATSTTTPVLDSHNSTDVETAVRAYFADIPSMINIAKCESDFTQYGASGQALNGGSGGMMGVFQINKSVHASFAKSLGDDIATLIGNMAYARYLYDQQGTEPWDSSKSCWGSVALPAVASSTLALITSAVTPAIAQASTTAIMPVAVSDKKVLALSQNLKVGSTGLQVTTLQQLLNAAGYKIAKTGPGSPGQETGTFGTATKLAVERFQCAHNIACSGSEGATGYGYVGAKTRAAIMVE